MRVAENAAVLVPPEIDFQLIGSRLHKAVERELLLPTVDPPGVLDHLLAVDVDPGEAADVGHRQVCAFALGEREVERNGKRT